MNPAELYQFLLDFLRAGAEWLAFSLVASLLLLVVLLFRLRSADRKSKERLEEAQRQARALESECANEKTLNAKLDEKLTQTRETKDITIGQLQGVLKGKVETLERYKKGLFQARDRFEQLNAAVAKAKAETADARASETASKEAAEAAHAEVARAVKQLRDSEQANEELENKLAEVRADLDRRLHEVVEQGGRVWERAVPANAPPFVPLGEARQHPIISILNLKGGVGKTTIALNLAATLVDRGKRVLVIDCDHQRSLTSLCLRQTRRNELHAARQTLQHFLLGPERTPNAFIATIYTPLGMRTCSLVANTPSSDKDGPGTDGLANVEERLMLEWLYQSGAADARLLLRSVLHSKEIGSRFDFVILDCPPRLSTATMNALVASDGVLIPVKLDATSATLPLPHLLRELRRLHSPELFPEFRLLGVVANEIKMHSGDLVSYQRPTWDALPTASRAAWTQPVHQFETMIPHDSAYSRSARAINRDAEHAVAAWTDTGVKAVFDALADEVLERINHEAPHLATVSS